MRTIKTETTVYTYEELSDDAKSKARGWYREMDAQSGDTFWAEYPTEEFKETLKACGFELASGRSRRDDALYWTTGRDGGAAFTASWAARNVNVDALMADRPTNTELHAILNFAKRLAGTDALAYGRTFCGRHFNQIDSEYNTGDDELNGDDRGELFEELCNDLAHHFYTELQNAEEYTQSDDCVAENIVANEYEFTEDGERFEG